MIEKLGDILNSVYNWTILIGTTILTVPFVVLVWFVFLPFATLLVIASKLSPNTQEDTE
jgi:hypothetical protein